MEKDVEDGRAYASGIQIAASDENENDNDNAKKREQWSVGSKEKSKEKSKDSKQQYRQQTYHRCDV
jgi:hypothetical protein